MILEELDNFSNYYLINNFFFYKETFPGSSLPNNPLAT